MLSKAEEIFVRILRLAVIGTAGCALLVAGCAALYGLYAYAAPEPTIRLSQHIEQMRDAVSPAELVKSIFPPDSDVARAAAKQNYHVYKNTSATVEQMYDAVNQFLQASIGGTLTDKKLLNNWLFGPASIHLSWSKAIDNENASDEDNVNVLWRSLFIDYLKRLSAIAPALHDANQHNLYPTAFDKLTAPTGVAHAPYFIAWYFDRLQQQLSGFNGDLIRRRLDRQELRSKTVFAFTTAAGAFAYFLTVMLVFLFISIEASAREVAAESRRTSSRLSAQA